MIVFYDGSCGICKNSAAFLRSFDKDEVLDLIDIDKEPLICELWDIPAEKAWAEIHGVADNGDVFCGIELVIQIQKALGYTSLYRFCNLPVFKQLFTLSFNILGFFRKTK